ncbi:class IV lanthionine synthetase LanL [Streptosporangium sp. CA-135522]|uniref:class IV lanthionine synthetase LanL n=1 Tax=Streptosporangium sp. CA-135522 TaxID=3240072 RepID=UPI003D8D3E50
MPQATIAEGGFLLKTRSGEKNLLRDIVIAELRRAGAHGWSAGDGEFWCKVTPDGYPMPMQGWKLHVSATMLSAPVVLSRVAPVLIGARCAFKFPARLDDYWELLAPHCPRAHAGKFVTAYPLDDDESARLAADLDEVTLGLPGPAILSDHPYRAGGIVHYRYGAFDGHRMLGNDGFYEVRLRTPEGELVRDERLPRFSPPPFATSPFTALQEHRTSRTPSEERTSEAPKPSAVVLNDRFVVREAVRHANRGGVYIAEDTKTGAEVIVKEGRPHACSDLSGKDARDRLGAERSCLDALAATGVVPAVVDFFEQGGHVFLVEEFVPGTTLRRWAEEHAGPVGHSGFGNGAAEVVPVAVRLVEAIRAVHRHGHVFRDLSPDNVMLLPGGDLRLVDLEHAAEPGTVVMVGGTPDYLAPELSPHSGRFRPAPRESADLYALGALVYFLVVGAAPGLAEDDVTGPASGRRIIEHVGRVAAVNPPLALLRPLVEGLLGEPDRRWSLDRCAEFLDALDPARLSTDAGVRDRLSTDADVRDRLPTDAGADVQNHPPSCADVRDRLPTIPDGTSRSPAAADEESRTSARIDDLVADGLARLTETMDTRDASPSPWPNVADGVEADPCAVNGGAAGILGVLALASLTEHGDHHPESGDRRSAQAGAVGRAVAATVRWLRRRLADEEAWRPGLYFGRSGAVWALYDAAEIAGDGEAGEFALWAASRLPMDHPSPDVTHGLAGCGMAVLRVALRSGEPGLRARAAEMFQNLHEARSYQDGRPRWPTPRSFDSGLAGADHLGFAHGGAGIGTALLYAAIAFDRPDWMASVREVAHALYEHADLDGDTAWWPTLPDEPRTLRPRRPHWCSGSSGIGSFLIRYWSATGDPAALLLAEKAAVAVHRTRWQTGSVPCHGLPGEGDFLLDMADFTADGRYLRWAEDLAGCLAARAVNRFGRLLVPDPRARVTPTFLGGTAGVLAFLIRLRHRNARLWMLDDVMGNDGDSPSQVHRLPPGGGGFGQAVPRPRGRGIGEGGENHVL